MTNVKKLSPYLLAILGSVAFLALRSSDLASDGNYRINLIAAGDFFEPQFAGWQHFLQVPLAYFLLVLSGKVGWAWSPLWALVSWGFIGNVLSLFFFFRAVQERLGSHWTAWTSGLVLTFSPIIFFFWNGEIVNLALGFSFCALACAVRQSRLWLMATFLALAALARADFAFIAPGLVWLHGRYEPSLRALVPFVRRLTLFTILTTLVGASLLYLNLFALGIVSLNPSSILQYLQRSYGVADDFIVEYGLATTAKAAKGLVATLSPAVNSLVEILRGTHGHYSAGIRGLYLAYGVFFLGSLAGAAVVAGRAWRNFPEIRSLLVGVLLLVFPSQLLFNWRFSYQTEEYHASSLVGVSLFVAVALYSVKEFPKTVTTLVGVFLAGFLLLFAWPAREFPLHQSRSANFLAAEAARQPITLLVCDTEVTALYPAGERVKQLPLMRLAEADWGAGPETARAALRKKIQAEFRAGRRLLLTGKKCNLDYLTRLGAKAPPAARLVADTDFTALVGAKELRAVGGPPLPLNWYNQYDPISWRYESIYELVP